MSDLPSEIIVSESSGGEVRYYLPMRPPDATRRIAGRIVVALGAFIGAMPILGIMFSFLIRSAGAQGGVLQPDVILPLLVWGPICFPLGGLILFWGLHVVIGHTEIQIRSQRLRILYKCGPLGLPRSTPFTKIRLFRVGNDVESQGADANTHAKSDEESSLMAHLTNGKFFSVCVSYPREWLLPLAEDLARRCQQLIDHDVNAPVEPILVQDAGNPAPFRDRLQKPMNSTAIMDLQPNGLTITIPPAGPLKGSSRFAVFWCLSWNAFVILFFPLFLYAGFHGKVRLDGGQASSLFVCLFSTPFVLIAIGSLVFLFLRGRRSTVLFATANSLEILDIDFFASHPYQWDAKKLRFFAFFSG